MTREEFQENVVDFCDLINFCSDNDCDICNEVYDEGSYNAEIDEYYLAEWVREYNWKDLKYRLEQLPEEYCYYRIDGYGNWEGLTDHEFEDYFTDVLQWGDDNGVWDSDEEEEIYDEDVSEPEEKPDPEDEIPIEEEDISCSDLFLSSVSELRVIRENKERDDAELESAFKEFITETASVV